MPAPYPWLSPLWIRLLRMRQRLPHALLLAGPKGVGKLELAQAWAQTLLCEQPRGDGEACGSCEGCHWFSADTHPDFMHLTLLEKETREGDVRIATEISVEQARQAVDFVQLSTYRAGHRLVLVEPAEALNTASANALLKVLEEPPINTVFVLVSHQPHQLPPTILSRCHKLEAGLPDKAMLQDWLNQNGLQERALAWVSGAPLAALEARDDGGSGDPHHGAGRPGRGGTPGRRGAGGSLEQAGVRAHLASGKLQVAAGPAVLFAGRQGGASIRDYEAALSELAQRASPEKLLDLARRESEAGRWVDHPLNRQMVMEAWLIEYGRIFEGAGN